MINNVLTGMPIPKKPTRRGRRKAKSGGDHFAAMREAHSHAKNGDHKSAKAALFKAIKAMRTPDEPEMEHNPIEEQAEAKVPKAKPAVSAKSPAVMLLLARRGKK